MASDDLEREEVARLVQELAPPRRAPTPGRRWTNARLLMPDLPAEPRKTLALPWDFHVPAWPSFRIPTLTAAQWNLLTARMWVGLGVVFSASMLYWPYARAGSWGLLLYLCAVALVVISGVWGAKLTWDSRLGGAHTIAVSVMVWGILLATATLLPLTGS